jgi:hypothetical protein
VWGKQNDYRDYALYLDTARYGTRDMVSRKSLTATIAGARTLADGTAVAVDQAAVEANGIRTSQVVENKFLTPLVPATQSITLAAGTWTMFCAGTGSVTYDGNEATDGTPVTFTLGGSTTADATVTGDLDYVQINSGEYPLPLNVSGSSWATEMGGDDAGVYLDDVESNFPDLYDALNGTRIQALDSLSDGETKTISLTFPTLTGDWLIAHNESGTVVLWYDYSEETFMLEDGTNTFPYPYAYEDGAAIDIEIWHSADDGKMMIMTT